MLVRQLRRVVCPAPFTSNEYSCGEELLPLGSSTVLHILEMSVPESIVPVVVVEPT